VILDTCVRFNSGTDEDDAIENQKLFEAILSLRALGARAVIGIHHSRKDLKEGEPTMEKAVRGSGDVAAMADVVWCVVRDDRLFQNNKGPNEVDVVGWGRDFNAIPMRLALTKKAPKDRVITFAPGLVSCIDEGADLMWVDRAAVKATMKDQLETLVQNNPVITLEKLAEAVEVSVWTVGKVLKDAGWKKPKGGAKGESRWVKT
jgi:hypothetical protein